LLESPKNFLHRANFALKNFEFLKLSREVIANATFIDERTFGGFSLKNVIGFDAVFEGLKKSGRNYPLSKNFIFHTSFCCSTLITKSLDKPGKVLSLREPNIFLNLCNYKRTPPFALVKTLPLETLLEASLKLINKPFIGTEKVLIKPSNIANNLIPDIFKISPKAKGVLLFQNQKNFLISFLKKGEPGRIFARKVFMILSLDDNNRGTEFFKNPYELTDLQIIAMLWVVQMQNFLSMKKQFPERTLLVNCNHFLSEPEETLTKVSDFLDFDLDKNHFKTVLNENILKKNSKFNTQKYSPEDRFRENKKIEKENAQSIGLIRKWSEPYIKLAHLSEISAMDA